MTYGLGQTLTTVDFKRLLVASRTSTTDFYINGSSVGSKSNSGVGSEYLRLFGYQLNGTSYYSYDTISFAFKSQGLTSSEVSLFTTRVNNLQTSLGRQV